MVSYSYPLIWGYRNPLKWGIVGILYLWYTCTMHLNRQAGSVSENRFQDELKYLYQRLDAVNNLIRALEEYDQRRPKPAKIPSTAA